MIRPQTLKEFCAEYSHIEPDISLVNLDTQGIAPTKMQEALAMESLDGFVRKMSKKTERGR